MKVAVAKSSKHFYSRENFQLHSAHASLYRFKWIKLITKLFWHVVAAFHLLLMTNIILVSDRQIELTISKSESFHLPCLFAHNKIESSSFKFTFFLLLMRVLTLMRLH